MRMKAARSLREMTRLLDTDLRLRRLCLINPGQAAYSRTRQSIPWQEAELLKEARKLEAQQRQSAENAG